MAEQSMGGGGADVVAAAAAAFLGSDAVREKLKRVSPGIAAVVGLYAPVIARLGAEDFFALVGMVQAGRGVEAQALLRERMSVAELAAEEKAIAQQLFAMAEGSFEARRIYAEVMAVVARAALGVALAGMAG